MIIATLKTLTIDGKIIPGKSRPNIPNTSKRGQRRGRRGEFHSSRRNSSYNRRSASREGTAVHGQLESLRSRTLVWTKKQ